jgi:hypothetical protein
VADCTTAIYFPLIEVIKQCYGGEIIVDMAQSFHFSDKLQNGAVGRRGISGSKFSMFTKIHIHVRSVTCCVTQFVKLYYKVFVFFRVILSEHSFALEQDNDFIYW